MRCALGARRETRRQAAERRAAEEQAARAAAKAAQRERRLNVVASQGEAAWRRVEEHIAAKKATDYDLAVALLEDLQEVSVRVGQDEVFRTRPRDLRSQRGNQPALMSRLATSELP